MVKYTLWQSCFHQCLDYASVAARVCCKVARPVSWLWWLHSEDLASPPDQPPASTDAHRSAQLSGASADPGPASCGSDFHSLTQPHTCLMDLLHTKDNFTHSKFSWYFINDSVVAGFQERSSVWKILKVCWSQSSKRSFQRSLEVSVIFVPIYCLVSALVLEIFLVLVSF